MQQQVEITILNWEKYNPKEMKKTPLWFRMERDILFSESLHGLGVDSKWVWIGILSVGCKKKRKNWEVDISWLSFHCGVENVRCLEILAELSSRGLLKYQLGVNSESTPSKLRATNKQTNETNESPMERPPIKNEIEKTASPVVAIAPPPNNQVSKLIGVYVESWQKRYGTRARPELGGKVQGIIKRLAKDHSFENLSLLIQAYCQMSDPWFEKKAHDMGTFEQNITKISLALDKGRSNPTERTWEDIVDELENKKGLGDAEEYIQYSIGEA